MTSRLGEYEVLEELADGCVHARSEAGLEVRLTPRPAPLPVPSLPPHPHVAEVLAVRDALVVSAWVPGVPLRALLDQAGTLPPFLCVILLQQLCRGLQHAHAQHASVPGEVTLESVVVGFDGRVRVTSVGAPGRDVPAAALVLDQLLGESLDAELTRIIGEAREPEATRRISTALALEQRLGHWQVKQRQLFPRSDLVAELMAWLYPAETGRAADEDIAAWFEEECTRVRPARVVAVRPRAAAPRRRWPIVVLGSVGALLGLAYVTAYVLFLKREVLPAPPPVTMVAVTEPALVPTPPAPTPPPAAPAIAVAPGEEPTLPRRGTGLPAKIRLSSKVHGVALETSGFGVTAPAPRWAAKTVRRRANLRMPNYGSLFVAEFDASHRLTRLGQVGITWTLLTQPEARFFVMQPDQRPDDGSFGLALGTPKQDGIAELPALLRPDVLTDAMTQLEYSRFVLEGLNPWTTYVVQLNPNAQGTTPPVIVTATMPRGSARSWSGSGFRQPGAPLDQLLLAPSVPVTVRDASRLSFVVLTTKDAPESLATVVVEPSSQQQVRAPLTPTLEEALVIDGLITDGKALMKVLDYESAERIFERCLALNATEAECQQLRALAVASKKRRKP